MTHNPGKTSPQSHSVHEVRGGVMLPAETLFYSLLTFFLFFFFYLKLKMSLGKSS